MKHTLLNLALGGLLTIGGAVVGCGDESNDEANSSELALRGGSKAADGGVSKGKGQDKVKTHGHDGGDDGDDEADESDASADDDAESDDDDAESGDGGAGYGKGGKPDKGGNGKGHDAGR